MEENITNAHPLSTLRRILGEGKTRYNLVTYPIQAITNLSKEKQTNH